jgi:chromosome segregation ATPase
MTTRERTAAAIESRRQNTQAILQRVQAAISVLRRQKKPITYAAVARRAEVSRTFLYENTDARTLVAGATTHAPGQHAQTQTDHDTEQDLAWRERAFNAEDALKATHVEIRSQRGRIGELTGRIRDLEQERSSETIGHITTENTTLKQRVRQLSEENRTLSERLQAARSNTRFQDRHIARLEAELIEHTTNITNMPATSNPRSEGKK